MSALLWVVAAFFWGLAALLGGALLFGKVLIGKHTRRFARVAAVGRVPPETIDRLGRATSEATRPIARAVSAVTLVLAVQLAAIGAIAAALAVRAPVVAVLAAILIWYVARRTRQRLMHGLGRFRGMPPSDPREIVLDDGSVVITPPAQPAPELGAASATPRRRGQRRGRPS